MVGGENGEGVPKDNSPAERRANAEFGFNAYASDKISMNRSIPDTRPAECKYWDYPIAKLPAASVVIVFHNEGSVLHRPSISWPAPITGHWTQVEPAPANRPLRPAQESAGAPSRSSPCGRLQ